MSRSTERDPFLTRGKPVRFGRYDGEPGAFAAKTGSLPSRPPVDTPRYQPPLQPTPQSSRLVPPQLSPQPSAYGAARSKAAVRPEPPPQPALHFHAQSVAVLVFLPWLTFTVTAVLTTLAAPGTFYNVMATVAVVTLGALAGLLVHVHFALKHGRIYLYLGLLCAAALALGYTAGMVLHERDMADYWLRSKRARHSDVAPTAPSEAFADAASLDFTPDARVDLRRILGYRPRGGRHTFCVAPVLGEADLTHVEFWAAGLDCCEPLWGFSCDDSLSSLARSGSVISGVASDFSAERYDNFQRAAHQAAAMYHLITPEEPVFVRWLEDPTVMQSRALQDGLIGVLLFCLLYFVFSGILAVLLHWSSARRPVKDPQ